MEFRVFLPILFDDEVSNIVDGNDGNDGNGGNDGTDGNLYNEYRKLLLLIFPPLQSSSSSSLATTAPPPSPPPSVSSSLLNLIQSYTLTTSSFLFSSLTSSLPHNIEHRTDKYLITQPNNIIHYGIKLRNYNSTTKKCKCEIKIKTTTTSSSSSSSSSSNSSRSSNDYNIENYNKFEVGNDDDYMAVITMILMLIIFRKEGT